MNTRLELEPLSVASEQVRLRWVLGGVSEITGIPKKFLRKAFRIVSTPKMEADILRRGAMVRKTFFYGFMSYVIKEKAKERKILEPHPDVQKVYVLIKKWLDVLADPHKKAFGFVKERNSKKALETLKALFRKGHHIAFDIADAFPSITDIMVEKTLKELGVEDSVAEVLAWFVTYRYQGKRRLPQGASSSPNILNLVYKPMCNEIDKICHENGISWSVYADDFNFSSENISLEIKERLLAVPEKFGFAIKPKKTKDNLGKTIPHLLGLTVVEGKIHISRKQKKKFRRIFYEAMKYDAYSPEVVHGIMRYIGHIYGEKENWPGWLTKIGDTK